MIIVVTSQFEKDYKRLAKKYPSISSDLEKFKQELLLNPKLGVALSNGFRKIRIAISSKGKGKSGGARIITFNFFVKNQDEKIILVTMYDKNEKESITDAEIKHALATL